ncbi:MAG TPA: type IV conjugative transfer system protein TraL [Clostridiales bacterium]|nr:type IV conjugative transfer system protein TraL [Clostridiales bacterium]
MVEIYRHTDDPMKLFFWEIDEVIVMSAACFLGIMIDMLLTFGGIGIACAYLLTRLKKSSSEGVMIHFLYWHGFLKLKGCPKSYIREFVG